MTGGVTYEQSVSTAESYSTLTNDILGITDSGSSCLILASGLYDFVIEKLLGMLSYYEFDD